MDIGDNGGDAGGFDEVGATQKPRALPEDLPKSLDDRKNVPSHFTPETEMYDAWQGTEVPSSWVSPKSSLTPVGQSQFLTTPVLAKPLQFNNLSLDDDAYNDDLATQRIGDSDSRLMEMLAAQAAHRDGSASEDENAVASDEKLSDGEKRGILQKVLNMAASNGDVERIQKILDGKAKAFVDIDAPDEEGTAPLIYASCFVGTYLHKA